MNTLENKIPPPFVAPAVGLGMWAATGFMVPLPPLSPVRVLPVIMVSVVSLGVAGSAVAAFARARTTIDPVNIETASRLVTHGVFRLTRNPMYLGLTGALVVWALLLGQAWGWIGPLAFAAYIDRFQIRPEERAMASKFGPDYAAYKQRVRRWI